MSGSHSPFSIQVDAFDPVSVSPDGQLKVTVVPSEAGFLSPSTLTGLSEASWGHFTAIVNYCDYIVDCSVWGTINFYLTIFDNTKSSPVCSTERGHDTDVIYDVVEHYKSSSFSTRVVDSHLWVNIYNIAYTI